MFASFIGGTFGLLFEIAGGLAVLAVLALVVMRVFNKDSAGKWWHLGRTKLGQAGDYASTIDPAGQMKQAAKDASAELANADTALIACETLQKSLGRQVENDKRTLAINEAKILKKLKSGVKDSDPEILELLRSVQSLKKAIEQNQEQITTQATIYKNTLQSANRAGLKIKETMQRADTLKVRLDLGEQSDRIASMLAKYNPANVNSTMAKIDQYEQVAQQKLDGFQSKAKVMADRGYTEVEEEETIETNPELNDLLNSIKDKAPKVTV